MGRKYVKCNLEIIPLEEFHFQINRVPERRRYCNNGARCSYKSEYIELRNIEFLVEAAAGFDFLHGDVPVRCNI